MGSPAGYATHHLNADQLLDLVLGITSPAARQSMLDHIATCARCEARLRDAAGSQARAQARQADALARAAQGPPAAGSRRGARHPSRFAVVSLALAAACTVVAGLFVTLRPSFRPSTRPPEGAAWLPRPDAGGLSRGGDAGDADTLLFAGLAAYDSHDLLRARRILEASRATGVLEQVRRVYLGNTLLHLGAASPAIEQLQSLDYTALPEPWRGESRWALAQALARAGRNEQADSLVRQLATEPGEIGNRARAGLQLRAP